MKHKTHTQTKKQRTPKVSIKRLNNLPRNPDINPLLTVTTMPVIRKKRQRNKLPIDDDKYYSINTGLIVGIPTIERVEEVDEENFVKIYAAGLAAQLQLSITARRVFERIMIEYQKTPMSGGYADSVYLAWFDNGLCGQSIDMSEANFNKGLWELLERQFIAPRTPNLFWINPALFFKGDRVKFVRTIVKTNTTKIQNAAKIIEHKQ